MTKEEFAVDYKSLINGYNEKLLECHNRSFNNREMPIEYIANYLKFMQDYYLITTPDDDYSKETENRVTAFIVAVKEYDRYKELTDLLKDTNLTEDTAKKYQEEKDEHWKKFIQWLMVNLGDGNNA